ncbi:MAG: 3-deoxy-7-phosphoheptulonate synthase [Chloroflexota bacterium]|nr:3-deoxy-7-phosphoheptulonate synthase [Chloroflexota bacterium]
MIVVMKHGATSEELQAVLDRIRDWGLQPHLSEGEERTIVGLIGDERPVNESALRAMSGVENIVPILKPYKLASREFHPLDTIVSINDVSVGDKPIAIMAGPCSVESREQLMEAAQAVRATGTHILRGGAYKPRTSPYSFQGLGQKGLDLLQEVRERLGMAVVTEVMAPGQVDRVCECADILQIGARNMQNFALLRAVGEADKPVLLKRGMMSSMEELLLAAEYILAQGNYRVMLCERGIRTFEGYTRFTLDISAVPVLKQFTHLPVIVDPSHASGNWEWVTSLSMAAVAAGADGLLVEVHPHPEQALSDGAQSLRPERFAELVKKVRAVAHAVGREL